MPRYVVAVTKSRQSIVACEPPSQKLTGFKKKKKRSRLHPKLSEIYLVGVSISLKIIISWLAAMPTAWHKKIMARHTRWGFDHSIQFCIMVRTSDLRTSISTNLASNFGLRRSLYKAVIKSVSFSSYILRRLSNCRIRKLISRDFPDANAALTFCTT